MKPFVPRLLFSPVLGAALAAASPFCNAAVDAPQTPAAPEAAASAAPAGSAQRIEVQATRSADMRQAETAAKVVVLREDLLKFGDKALSDALRRVPGVTVDTEVRLRGMGSGYTQILIDGEPAPSNFSIDSIDPELIERIEVLRAPAAEFSMRAIAGTINLVLRKRVTAAQRGLKFGVDADAGQWQPSASLQWSAQEGPWAYQVAGAIQFIRPRSWATIHDEVRDAGGALQTLRVTEMETRTRGLSVQLSPRLTWKDEEQSVSWQWLLQRYSAPAEWTMRESTLAGLPSQFPFSDWSNQSYVADTVRSDLSWNRQLGESGRFEAKLGVHHLRRDTQFEFDGYGSEADYAARQLALNRSVVSDAVDDTVTSKGKHTRDLGDDHRLAIGWEAAWIRRSEKRLQLDRSGSGDLVYSLDQAYVASVRQVALYAQDEWSLSSQLQVYLGVRWEGLSTEVTGRNFERVGNDSSVVSPVAQLVWKLPGRPKDQVRLGLSRTYKAPATVNLVPRRYTVNNNNGPTNSDNQGNPALRPELAWGVDAAYESYFAKGAFWGVSAYARRIESVITRVLFQDGTEWVNSQINNGDATAYGLELELRSPARALWASAPDATFSANLSWNGSRVDSVPRPYNVLGSQTPLSANLGIDFHAGAQLTLGGNFSYRARSRVRITPEWITGSGSTRTHDLYGLWKFDSRSSLRLGVANALHPVRRDTSQYQDASGTSLRSFDFRSTVKVRLTLELQR